MWQSIRTAVLLLAVVTLLTGVLYPLAVTGLAQALFPWQANGSLIKIDELVKSQKSTPNVMPTKAGIQKYQIVRNIWTPAFAGVTTFYEPVKIDGEKRASERIGQPFSGPQYFWGRPSATLPAAYNGASSAGSNLGPSNPALKEAVGKRIAALRSADPENSLPVPVDLVTASGSGLDPDVSPAAALYQVPRVARARGIDEGRVAELVRKHIRDRAFGIFGEPRVNVLRLNMALEALR